MFPLILYRRQAMKIIPIKKQEFSARCRMPQLPDITMICCSLCKERFHGDVCIGTLPRDTIGSRRKDGSVLFALNNSDHIYMFIV